MRRTPLCLLAVVVLLCVRGLVGCGGSEERADEEASDVVSCCTVNASAMRALRVGYQCVPANCDAGVLDASVPDAGDAGDAGDGGGCGDGGMDGGDGGDAGCGSTGDGGSGDGGSGDGGSGDGGSGDGGSGDGGSGDGGSGDGGSGDGGSGDGGSGDGGSGDGGSGDGGSGDGGSGDGGSGDDGGAGDGGGDAGNCNPGSCWSDPPFNSCDMTGSDGKCWEVNCVQPTTPCGGQATSNGLGCCGGSDAGTDAGNGDDGGGGSDAGGSDAGGDDAGGGGDDGGSCGDSSDQSSLQSEPGDRLAAAGTAGGTCSCTLDLVRYSLPSGGQAQIVDVTNKVVGVSNCAGLTDSSWISAEYDQAYYTTANLTAATNGPNHGFILPIPTCEMSHTISTNPIKYSMHLTGKCTGSCGNKGVQITQSMINEAHQTIEAQAEWFKKSIVNPNVGITSDRAQATATINCTITSDAKGVMSTSSPSVDVSVDSGGTASDQISVTATGSDTGWSMGGGVTHSVSQLLNDGTLNSKFVSCDGSAGVQLSVLVNTGVPTCTGQGLDMQTSIGPNTVYVYSKGVGRTAALFGYDGEGYSHVHPLGGPSKNYISVRPSGQPSAIRLDTNAIVQVRYNTVPASEYRLFDPTLP